MDFQAVKEFPVPDFLEFCKLVLKNGEYHVYMLIKDKKCGSSEALEWFDTNLKPIISEYRSVHILFQIESLAG